MGIARLRIGKRVSLGDGGDDVLNRHVRAHGNFIECVPMAVILMVIAELSGSPLWCIHGLGVMMLVSRGLHFFGLTTGKGYGVLRASGVMLTFAVYVLGGVLCVWLSLPLLFSR